MLTQHRRVSGERSLCGRADWWWIANVRALEENYVVCKVVEWTCMVEMLRHLQSDCNIATPTTDLLALKTCGINTWKYMVVLVRF
jgi:hypothetical protein